MPTSMASSSRIDTAATGELESLFAQQAAIQSRIASLLPSNASQHHRSPIHKQQQQHRRRDVPRSMSVTGSTMSRHLSSSDRIEVPSQRSRTLSQRSAQSESMARTSSKGSTSSRNGNLPFTGTMAPPLLSHSRLENPAIAAWQTYDQPLSSYTFSHQPHQTQRLSLHQRRNLEQVPEQLAELDNVGEDPATWMARNGLITSSVSLTPSPVVPVTTSHKLSIDTQQDTFSMQLLSTPPSDLQSLTTATTLNTNQMSRQNSLFYETLPEGIEMMKFNSQNSFSTDINDQDHLYTPIASHFTSSHPVRRSSDDEQSQILVGLVGVTSYDSQFSQSFPSTEVLAQSPSFGLFGEKMEKSHSVESTSSSTSSSSSSRSKQRLQAQIAAERLIMPKGCDGTAMSRDYSSQSMARFQSKDGSKDKIAITKPTYQRPKHDRVFCKKCDDHPDGFRGEHELRRHDDRQHRVMVKKWVCVTPSNPNKHRDLPKPAIPLSKCKACSQQSKKYGAYYNAAAHLRRAHFRPKAKGRSKASKLEDAAKRGGKGGGNWPSMEDLKPWMMEVEEMATDFSLTQSQQEEADTSDDEFDILDDSQNPNTSLYNDSYLFPSPTSTDLYGMMTNLDIRNAQNDFPIFQSDTFAPSIPQTFDDSLHGNDSHLHFPSSYQ